MPVTTEIQGGIVLADRFRVHRRLGAGGMATVFLAEDCVLCRDVAIKRLHTEGSDDDQRRFRREARLGASLSHPNLVTIFDTLSGPDGVLIVMEYVQGRPLSELIGSPGMAPSRLLEILHPVASALDHAHDHGVVHRDVKPANILLAEGGRVKLVDLGTATASHVTQITSEHEVAGTLPYMAPERLSAETPGEPAADVYSLAVVAFEGLTGRRPHEAKTPQELHDKIVEGPPPEIAEAWPQAPPKLARVLKQGLHPDPNRRQPSAGRLVRDLEFALQDEAATEAVAPRDRGGPAQPVAIGRSEPITVARRRRPPPPPRRAEAVPKRRRAWLLPALACLGLLLAGGAGWIALSGGDDQGGKKVAAKKPKERKADKPPALPEAASPSAPAPSAPAEPAEPSPTLSSSVSDPALGAELNNEGYSLIQQGLYEEAVPVLQRAVKAFPAGSNDINYAYALFNLGHALRMAGRPQEAIPFLEQRLEFPNQTETVQAELDAARAAAGQ